MQSSKLFNRIGQILSSAVTCTRTDTQSSSTYHNYAKETPESLDIKYNTLKSQHTELTNLINSDVDSVKSEYIVTNYVSFMNNDMQNLFGLYQLYDRKDMRDTLAKYNTEWENMQIELNNHNLYKHVKNVMSIDTVNDPELVTYMEKIIKQIEHTGVLSENRALIQANTVKINELTTSINSKMNGWDKFILLNGKGDELFKGLSQEFVDKHRTGDNQNEYKITTQYPDVIPILTECHNRDTRQQAYTLLKNKGYPIVDEELKAILKLRAENAKLLNHKYYSDTALQLNLYTDAKEVMRILKEHKSANHENVAAEIKASVESVNKYLTDNNLEPLPENSIEIYDLNYIQTMLKRQHVNINISLEPSEVITAVTAFYNSKLGLRFVDNTALVEGLTWAPDISVLEVYDEKTNKYYGSIYMDLKPREGKFGHAACFQLEWAHNDVTHNKCVMVANMGEKLTFNDFETFLHEFGHCIHAVMNTSTIKPLNSFGVEKDFVEVPSTLFQEFAYNKEVLLQICPKLVDNIDKIKQGKQLFKLTIDARQLAFAMYDMHIHSLTADEIDKVDLNAVLCGYIEHNIPGIHIDRNGLHEYSSFMHIINGYDCGYYGYLLSESIANGLYESYFNNNPHATCNFATFKEFVLMRGSRISGTTMLNDFRYRAVDNSSIGFDYQTQSYCNK
jgi:thimet oligopeptidase